MEAIRTIECEESLLDFIRDFWEFVEPGRKFTAGRVLEEMVEHLQAVTLNFETGGAEGIWNALINVPPGCMKALSLDTPVLTTWGWKCHGDLRPGDFVFGPDGEPKRVLGVTPHKVEECLEVIFDTGCSLVAGHGHLWQVERQNMKGGRRRRETVIVPTPDLQATVSGQYFARPDCIPCAEPVCLRPSNLLIDPYVLGVWLGDGNSNGGSFSCGHEDIEHFKRLGRIGSVYKPCGTRKQKYYRITVEGLCLKLRTLGLLNNKGIPENYLESSVEQRLELVRGLMDTDGCATKDGYCMFVNKNEKISDGLATALSSLGVKVSRRQTYSVLNGEKLGHYHEVRFCAPHEMQVFKLARKQNRVRFAQKKARSRYISLVRKVDARPINCICVEGGMYLVGKDFIATHNSLLVDVFWPAWEWGPRNLPHLRYLCFSYSEDLTLRDNGRFATIIKSEKYQRRWGDRVILEKDTQSKLENTKKGWKIATSVGGVGTGERGDRVIVDDPHNVKDGESEVKRNSTLTWWKEVLPTRLNDAEISSILVIMQRVHEEDVSGDILSRQLPYVHLMLPMEYDPDRHCETDVGGDWRSQEGELLWPERFSQRAVDGLKHTLGRFATASQLQQSPSPRGGGIIKSDDWQLWDEVYAQRMGIFDPKVDERLPYPQMNFVLASLDTAFGKKKENDYNALTILGCWKDENDQSRIMLMDCWKKRLTLHGKMPPRMVDESDLQYLRRTRKEWGLVEHVVSSCRRLKVDRLLIEDSAQGKPVDEELARLFAGEKFAVELVPAVQDKVARLYSVQHVFSQGIVFAPDMDWADSLIRNTSNFPKVTHDDDVDSLTQGLRWLRDTGWALRSDERDREMEAQSSLEAAKVHEPLYDV